MHVGAWILPCRGEVICRSAIFARPAGRSRVHAAGIIQLPAGFPGSGADTGVCSAGRVWPSHASGSAATTAGTRHSPPENAARTTACCRFDSGLPGGDLVI